jgi:hypothetical protein
MAAVSYTFVKVTVELGDYPGEVWTATSDPKSEYVEIPDGQDVVSPHELREIGFAVQRAILLAKEDVAGP